MSTHCSARHVIHLATLISSLLCSSRAFGQPVVLESAALGTTGRFGGTSVTTSQFVGWRFQTSVPLVVERVGGHLLSFPDQPGDIFAALVRLQSINSVPLGAPFTPEEIVATTTFRPPFPSNEVLVPLGANLPPGSYTLVFGTGLFGATGAGALHNGDDQPDIPPTDISSFIFWSVPFFGQPFEWRLNLASHMRFVIEAHQVNVPGDYNGNGIVDAADYALWRKIDATQPGYDAWRTHFGQTTGSGPMADAIVPEPSSTWPLILAAATTAWRIRRNASAPDTARRPGSGRTTWEPPGRICI